MIQQILALHVPALAVVCRRRARKTANMSMYFSWKRILLVLGLVLPDIGDYEDNMCAGKTQIWLMGVKAWRNWALNWRKDLYAAE
jgi:hypothetical protein